MATLLLELIQYIEINRNLYMNEKNLTINKNIIKIQKSFYNIFNDFHYDFKLAAE